MTTFNTDQWMILGLVFVLGLLIGMWLTSGGRRKWKARHAEELDKRKALEKSHAEREAEWAAREKDLREEDSRRAAAMRDRPVEVVRERPVEVVRDRPIDDVRGTSSIDPDYRDARLDPRDRPLDPRDRR